MGASKAFVLLRGAMFFDDGLGVIRGADQLFHRLPHFPEECTETWSLEIVNRSDLHRFVVFPRRWIVEGSLGWVSRTAV